MEPLFSSSRPEGRTVLTIRTGDASTTATDLNLQGVTCVRVWPDHTHWSFLWQ